MAKYFLHLVLETSWFSRISVGQVKQSALQVQEDNLQMPCHCNWHLLPKKLAEKALMMRLRPTKGGLALEETAPARNCLGLACDLVILASMEYLINLFKSKTLKKEKSIKSTKLVAQIKWLRQRKSSHTSIKLFIYGKSSSYLHCIQLLMI